MSFASHVKKELYQNTCTDYLMLKAEYYGMVIFAKSFLHNKIVFTTENKYAASRFIDLSTILYAPIIEQKSTLKTSRNNTQLHTISIIDESDCKKIFEDLGHLPKSLNLRINRANLDGEKYPSPFLRGAFLSCGSVNDPSKNYHLEFCVPFKGLSSDLATIITEIEQTDILPKVVCRGGNFVVYIKDSEQIADLLTYMGAPNSSMEIMGTKAMKHLRNTINRKLNSEVANITKIADASARQVQAIKKIDKYMGLNKLTDDLKEIALLRLENPELSLRDLGTMTNPPISRSGVNHRMARILEIYEKIRNNKDKE